MLVSAVLAAPILRYASPGFHALVYTPWRSDSLLSGASLAVLVRWHPFVSAVQQRRRVLLLLFAAMLGGTAVMTLRPGQSGAFNHFWLAVLYTVFVLIAFAGAEPCLGNLLRSPVLVWFGQLSYGIYMFHQPISGLLHGVLRHGAPQIRTPLDAGVTVLALCVTLLLAMLSYHFFETPILRFGHRFQYSPKRRWDPSSQAVLNEV